ncbi:unnamed protein product (macronuclear) [Paramecium tetraurelia]|uniref:Uncharacterized protein n=1 Tax=Paramecium tetraurelia TaxID=5888 RepID=A0DWE8_PARTE|nr:uncharacterized protein GSPATT00021007001 [Paramecium tetraurelia]CAK87365.1 unnamed protein product [Paramecium tetraurelia]|eukprot:XP_001454762.1 hypothetical protein (macronuclear) [Paramecium tetraurelia strain d4-2]
MKLFIKISRRGLARGDNVYYLKELPNQCWPVCGADRIIIIFKRQFKAHKLYAHNETTTYLGYHLFSSGMNKMRNQRLSNFMKSIKGHTEQTSSWDK